MEVTEMFRFSLTSESLQEQALPTICSKQHSVNPPDTA